MRARTVALLSAFTLVLGVALAPAAWARPEPVVTHRLLVGAAPLAALTLVAAAAIVRLGWAGVNGAWKSGQQLPAT